MGSYITVDPIDYWFEISIGRSTSCPIDYLYVKVAGQLFSSSNS